MAGLGGAACRVVSPPSAPASTDTVSSGDWRGGALAGPAPPTALAAALRAPPAALRLPPRGMAASPAAASLGAGGI
eukprot:8974041-Alexandrium_andersonii.AAC.1